MVLPPLRRRAPRAPPDERPHLITHLSPAEVMEALRAEFEAFDVEGLAKYEALVQQDVERFRRECEERGFDPAELMRG